MRRPGAAFAVLVAACTQAMPPTPAAVPGPGLPGEWRVLAVNGRPTSGSAKIAPPIFTIDFGCNWGRGGSRIEGSALIPVMPMAVTERACMNLDGTPAASMQHEDEGFRIASRPMQFTFHGPDRVRLSNEAGTIDLER